MVGAAGKDSSTGAAYVFARSGEAWSRQAKLTASDAAEFDEFGASVGISGATVVLGAPGKDFHTGAAYVFARFAAPGPAVTTGSASAIGAAGATLHGTVNPEGQATSYVFQYGTTTRLSRKMRSISE